MVDEIVFLLPEGIYADPAKRRTPSDITLSTIMPGIQERHMKALATDQALYLNFKQVDCLSSRYADHLVVNLLRLSQSSIERRIPIIVQDASEVVTDSLGRALHTLGQILLIDRNCTPNQFSLLGIEIEAEASYIPHPLSGLPRFGTFHISKEIVEYLSTQSKLVSSAELARGIGIKRTTVLGQIKKLCNAGICKKGPSKRANGAGYRLVTIAIQGT